MGQSCKSANHDNVCVYPRDDVNTPHESTQLLGRGGRAAQFGCSRSSLVTRRNSAQVVLLCGECGTGVSTYDLSLPLYLSFSLLLFLSVSALFVFPTLLSSFCSSLYAAVFTPFHSLPAVTFPSLSSFSFSSFSLPCRFFSYTSPTILLYILPSRLTNRLTD